MRSSIRLRAVSAVCLMIIIGVGIAVEQVPPDRSLNLLGPHNTNGRGCASCHAPASGSFGSAQAASADAQSSGQWAVNATPLYGKTIAFGEGGRYVEVLPSSIAIGSPEVDGILLCLSCHDGNVTSQNMMAGQSFEQRVGLLTNSAYGGQPIPTLLGVDGSYTNDHPVGTTAIIPAGDGLLWVGNKFTVIPSTPYAQFVANYGRPSLVSGEWFNPWGVNHSGQPFVLCTTCHNQHLMTIYASSSTSPIASDGGGRLYSTYFFVNGPYNPNTNTAVNSNAASTAQFCRQCHFVDANEANNSNTVTTILSNY